MHSHHLHVGQSVGWFVQLKNYKNVNLLFS
jgi:hypothetical protein